MRFGLLVFLAPGVAWASTVDVLQQVRLLDALGAPIVGSVPVSVAIVGDDDPALPDTVCHTASLGPVAFDDGYASLSLHSVPASCFNGPSWIAVSVDGAEIGPRHPVHDVPRAGLARQVHTAASPTTCSGPGELIYDTVAGGLLVCDGAAWQAVGGGSSLGDVRESLLTESQFQAINGSGWVLMDGRDITGSDLASLTGMTTLPDARGVVLRGKNNGRSTETGNPDGDLALGASQTDALGSHSHSIISNPHTGSSGGIDRPAAFNQGYPRNGLGPTSYVVNGVETRVIPYGRLAAAATGANETRMRNVTVNMFVRID